MKSQWQPVPLPLQPRLSLPQRKQRSGTWQSKKRMKEGNDQLHVSIADAYLKLPVNVDDILTKLQSRCRNSVETINDRPDMTSEVDRERKALTQLNNKADKQSQFKVKV